MPLVECRSDDDLCVVVGTPFQGCLGSCFKWAMFPAVVVGTPFQGCLGHGRRRETRPCVVVGTPFQGCLGDGKRVISTYQTTYASESRQDIRLLLVNAAEELGIDIRRVLTLPTREGYCASLFKERFPDCHVVGVNLGKLIVQYFDHPAVDEIFQGNVLNLTDKSFRKPTKSKTIKGSPYPKLSNYSYGIEGRFDLLYIDLTSKIGSPGHREKLSKILYEKTNEHAVVGLTYSRFDLDEEAERSYLESIGPDWNLTIHNYSNAFSDMLLGIYTR